LSPASSENGISASSERLERYSPRVVSLGKFTPGEPNVKKISYIIAALTTISIAAPALAQDKPMMKHHMMMKKHHVMMHHKKMMMKKDGM
jgi:hypothetical protein